MIKSWEKNNLLLATHKPVNVYSFKKIFTAGTCLSLYLILQAFNLEMLPDKRRRFNIIFRKHETNPQK